MINIVFSTYFLIAIYPLHSPPRLAIDVSDPIPRGMYACLPFALLQRLGDLLDLRVGHHTAVPEVDNYSRSRVGGFTVGDDDVLGRDVHVEDAA